MMNEDNINIGEAARLGQAINLASSIVLSINEPLNYETYHTKVVDLVFKVTLPMITQIRSEYVQRRDTMREEVAEQQYDQEMLHELNKPKNPLHEPHVSSSTQQLIKDEELF